MYDKTHFTGVHFLVCYVV